jgi:RNA polymerase sigma factor (sigma-70 family)
MQTIQAAAFVAAEVDRNQEIALGEQIMAWREAKASGIADPRTHRQGQNAAAKLAEVNQRYLPNVLKKYFGYTTIENDELWTTGFLGLVQAANAYNPSRGYFWPFAKKYVHGEVQDLLRKNYPVILPKGKFAKAQKDPELKALLTYAPINEEIVGGTEESEEEDWNCSIEELHEAIASLPLDLREVIERAFGVGCAVVTQTAIAQDCGVSSARISSRKKEALQLLKEFLTNPENTIKTAAPVVEIELAETVWAAPEPEPEVVEAAPESTVAPEPASMPAQEALEVEAVEEPLETISEPIEAAKGFGVVAKTFKRKAVRWVKKALNPVTIGQSILKLNMECPNCHAKIPNPPDGTKVSCSKCFSLYERVVRGSWTSIKSGFAYAALIYKDKCLNFPHKPKKETNRFEQRRIKTFNNLARVYHELGNRGKPFEHVQERVLNLWRETDRYRIFDESAMERVGVWIEEVEKDINRNTT